MTNPSFKAVAGVAVAYQDPTCALPQPRKFRVPALLCVACPGTRAWMYLTAGTTLRSVISSAAAGDRVNFSCSGTITLTSDGGGPMRAAAKHTPLPVQRHHRVLSLMRIDADLHAPISCPLAVPRAR
jgi:hypothetical protein